jgi:hypothetical protein
VFISSTLVAIAKRFCLFIDACPSAVQQTAVDSSNLVSTFVKIDCLYGVVLK